MTEIIFSFLCLVLFFLSLYLYLQKRSVSLQVRELKNEVDIQLRKSQYQRDGSLHSLNQLHSMMQVIMDLTKDLSTRYEEEPILKVVVEKIKLLLAPKRCAVFIKDKDSFGHLYSYGYSKDIENVKITANDDSGIVGWSATVKRLLTLDQINSDPTLSHLLSHNPFKCTYSQPLVVDNEVKALICIDEPSQKIEQAISLRLLTILSGITNIALKNALFTTALKEKSIRDSLTNFYHHSFFHQYLNNLLKECKEAHNSFSLAFIDLDYFKRINDTFGHQSGDFVILGVTQKIKSLQDAQRIVPCRYGGDEFAVIFEGLNADDAYAVLEDLRGQIANHIFKYQGNNLRITLSIGIAEFNPKRDESMLAVSKEELLERADKGLYLAKSKGRNKVVVSNEKD